MDVDNEYIRKIFFIYDENAEEERISKTRVISLAVFFIVFFWYLHDIIFNPAVKGHVILGPIFAGLFVSVPTFVVGYVISKILNRPKNRYDPEKIEKDGINFDATKIVCNDEEQFNQTIQVYSSQKYKLQSMTKNMAILSKKRYNVAILIILVLFLWPAALIYIFYYYFVADEEVIIVTLDKDVPAATSDSENKEFASYCSKCGHGLYDDSKFCPECGDIIKGKD